MLAAALASTQALDKSPIVRQLNASLSWYDSTNPVLKADDRLAAAKQWLRGYLWNRSNTVLILDNRILVDGEFLRSTGDKGRRHLRFLATLVYSGRQKVNRRKIARRLPSVRGAQSARVSRCGGGRRHRVGVRGGDGV